VVLAYFLIKLWNAVNLMNGISMASLPWQFQCFLISGTGDRVEDFSHAFGPSVDVSDSSADFNRKLNYTIVYAYLNKGPQCTFAWTFVHWQEVFSCRLALLTVPVQLL
jgi:hypothetical protein